MNYVPKSHLVSVPPEDRILAERSGQFAPMPLFSTLPYYVIISYWAIHVVWQLNCRNDIFFVAPGKLRGNSDTGGHGKALHIRFPYLAAYQWRVTSVSVKGWESRRLFQRSLRNFTFMLPCIATDLFVIKPTRCTNFTNLFWHEIPHVTDSSSVHHQEFIHCTLRNGVCHTGL